MNKQSIDTNKQIREASGKFESNDRLTYFLYLLMRDYMPAGDLENLFRKSDNEKDIILYSNGFIAKYASYLSKELKKIN